MDKRMIIITFFCLILAFMYGYINSYSSGIQPGYFEKAEAPAYGVGGGSAFSGMDEEFQKHLEELYQEDDGDD
jgi:hypothetical protein